ncbi:hypothetical protein [Rhodoferax sp. TH121]|uniref:hypothetical protein n=1 Tax=Rhodoferax sp. TH121 TaxID=2022803 RepID=UPI0011403C66|nr:hypothetical protein [Rhodoferax sp. TH121]
MKPTKPASPPTVTPPASWKVVSAYGSLQTRAGVDLVRLEEVHASMCEKGIPPKEATYDIFAPFYTECIAAVGGHKVDAPLIEQLHAACALDRPITLFRDGALSRHEHARPYGLLPELGHVRLTDGSPGGVLYTLGEAALRVWVGSADRTTDHAEVWKAKRTATEEQKYGIEWPSDDALCKVLGRIAVSHDLAHRLWGWGTVGVAAMDASQNQVESLVGTVAKSKVAQRELAPDWSGERLAKRQAELKTECLAQGLRNFTALLATECGLPIREVTRRIKAVKGNSLGAMAEQLKRQAK